MNYRPNVLARVSRRTASLAIAVALASAAPLSAESFRPGAFRYYRAIEGLNLEALRSPNSAVVFARFPLDETTLMNSHGPELRVTLGGRLLPHLRREIPRAAEAGRRVAPTIVYTRRVRESRVYVLKLPPAPAGQEYAALAIESDGAFESGVHVSAGENPDNWNSIGYYSLYRYSNEAKRSLRIQPGAAQYLRLEFDGSAQEFRFPYAELQSSSRSETYTLNLEAAQIRQDFDPDLSASVYYFVIPGGRTAENLTLRFKETRFRRQANLEYFDQEAREFASLGSAVVSRRGPEDANAVQTLELGRVRGEIKVSILNQDDAPLTLESAAVNGPLEEIVFQAPGPDEMPETENVEVRLYYGSEYTRAPAYDIRIGPEDEGRIVSLKAGPEQQNGEFAYALLDPPVSVWILRVLFLAGLAALALPAWRLFRKFAADANATAK